MLRLIKFIKHNLWMISQLKYLIEISFSSYNGRWYFMRDHSDKLVRVLSLSLHKAYTKNNESLVQICEEARRESNRRLNLRKK